jgi:two-component system sensor histidine kinase UhpB
VLALRETREIARNLHPAQLKNLGLAAALRSLIASVESATGLQCEVEIGEIPPDLSYEAAINIYRISQESLSNIIKHSAASMARIELKVDDEKLVLTIEDDGRGFTPHAGPGLGLSGMRERAAIIGADLTIESHPGEGTKVQLNLNPNNGQN